MPKPRKQERQVHPPPATPPVEQRHEPVAPAFKKPGRPPKPSGTKAKGLTVMLWPDELARLEQLHAAVDEGSPGRVARSDLARLAFSLLLDLSPEQVRAALARRRR